MSSRRRGVPPRLILLSAASAARQSATAAAHTATSTGSAARHAASMSSAVSTRTTCVPGGSGSRRGPGHQRHVRALVAERSRDRVALLARRAVGDVAHRVDRLVRRSARDQRADAGEGPAAGDQPFGGGHDRRRFGHAAGADLAAREIAVVGSRCGAPRPRQEWRRCAASPDATTCARSLPARSGPACWWRAGRWTRDRWRDPRPSSRSGPRSPARPPRGPPRATGGYDPSRSRR